MTDAHLMGEALELARCAAGRTAPNPAVGAVVVRDGVILGRGWTRPPGEQHAEVVALQDCVDNGHDPRGADMFVTLEPCSHHGRTEPCTDAILTSGIRRVVAGVVDPFPANQGRGLALLRARGIEVEVGVLAERCARQILGFARRQVAGLPEVTCKAAISADGHIATAAGESQWITSPLARERGRQLRAEHDAIIVGIGTVLHDDPRLTARIDGAPDPIPVVLDSARRLPPDAQLLAGGRAVVVCAAGAEGPDLDATVIAVPRGDGGVDIEAALRAIAGLGVNRVLVEGGGKVHRSLLDAGLVDSLELFVAGMVIPGGRPWVAGPPLESLADAPRMTLDDVERVGPDAWLRYRLEHRLSPDPLSAFREGPRSVT